MTPSQAVSRLYTVYIILVFVSGVSVCKYNLEPYPFSTSTYTYS